VRAPSRPLLLSPPTVGPRERERLLQAFDSGWIAPAGPDLPAFEAEVAELTGRRRAVAVGSGTAALHLALLAAGVGPGDEVLVPSFTFAASANPVVHAGARPVFVDSSPGTWTLDPDLVTEELRTAARRGRPVKAVVAVDIYGQCADYVPLAQACDRYGAVLVEDAAEALGADHRGRPAGSFGASAVLSFNGNKIITTGGGGMLVTDDDATADLARSLATQAREPVAHYEHHRVGYNYRLSNLLAAVGRAQLETLAERVERRRQVYALYARELAGVPGLTMMPLSPLGTSNCWLTCILVDPETFGARAEQVIDHLGVREVEARRTWKPLHLQRSFAGCRIAGSAVAEALFDRGVSLPSGFDLTDDEVRWVAREVAAAGTAVATARTQPAAVAAGTP
jgi:dTDP-4-amino-4,6-dideoxygalactose transaminase